MNSSEDRAPEQRFSDRVERYIQYRPGYPPAVIDLLRRECDLKPSWCVADIGSGTGLLTELFLRHGNRVIGVEPNPPMRAAGEALLQEFPRFVSSDGSAEQTGLADRSVDLIVAGQAFHWFDQARARPELARVLKPDGWVALIWNERRRDTPFMSDYETVLSQHCPEYEEVNHHRLEIGELGFFAPGSMRAASFDNQQRFTWEGLLGRALSSSYAPAPGDPGHEPLRRALRTAFEQHQRDGIVQFDYHCRVYCGRLLC